MENVKISDREAMGQVRAILDRMNPGSPFAIAIRRVFAESPVEAEAGADKDAFSVAPSAVDDAALRSVRLPEATVRQWEAESHQVEA